MIIKLINQLEVEIIETLNENLHLAKKVLGKKRTWNFAHVFYKNIGHQNSTA